MEIPEQECRDLNINIRARKCWNYLKTSCEKIINQICSSSEIPAPLSEQAIGKDGKHEQRYNLEADRNDEINLKKIKVKGNTRDHQKYLDNSKHIKRPNLALSLPNIGILCRAYVILGLIGTVGCAQPHEIIALTGHQMSFSGSVNKNDTIWCYKGTFETDSGDLFYAGNRVDNEYRDRYSVSNTEDSDRRLFKLTIYNATLNDAGNIQCIDGSSNEIIAANIAVATELQCSANCGDDLLNVSCSTCYKSKDADQLKFLLHHQTYIRPDKTSIHYNNECTTLEAEWLLERVCPTVNQDELFVKLMDNYGTATVSSGALKVHVLPAAGDQKEPISPRPIISPIIKMAEKMENSTQKLYNESKDLFSNHILITAVIPSVFAVTVVVLVVLLYRNRRRARRSNRAQLNGTQVESGRSNGYKNKVLNGETKPLKHETFL